VADRLVWVVESEMSWRQTGLFELYITGAEVGVARDGGATPLISQSARTDWWRRAMIWLVAATDLFYAVHLGWLCYVISYRDEDPAYTKSCFSAEAQTCALVAFHHLASGLDAAGRCCSQTPCDALINARLGSMLFSLCWIIMAPVLSGPAALCTDSRVWHCLIAFAIGVAVSLFFFFFILVASRCTNDNDLE
jgi:hypothetical protein